MAAPLAAGTAGWLLGLLGASVLMRRARHLASTSRWLLAGTCGLAAVVALWLPANPGGAAAGRGVFTPVDPPNTPTGVARGVQPGRVAWAHDPAATTWDGHTGTWSQHVNQSAVDQMCAQSLRWLAGEANELAAWDALFHAFNLAHGKGDVGYQPGEKIAIKVNLVNISTAVGHVTDPGNRAYNSPQLLRALLHQLVTNVGVQPADITVYDASRLIPSTLFAVGVGDLAGVRFVDAIGGDGRIAAVHDPALPVVHADSFVPPRWLPTCVTDAQYVVNLAHLKGHYYTGATLCAKNHFGSTWVESGGMFWPGELIHQRVNAYAWDAGPWYLDNPTRPMGSYNPLVELMGHQHLGEKTVLFMVDGLYVPVHQNASMLESPPWQSRPFNGHWTSSVFASQDGVAIDSVCVDFLRSEPTQTYLADASNQSTVDDYLHEAARADAPPSGTFYDPEGDGSRLASLGVHEHFRSAADRRYSRNLGTGHGIELYSASVVEDGFETQDTSTWSHTVP